MRIRMLNLTANRLKLTECRLEFLSGIQAKQLIKLYRRFWTRVQLRIILLRKIMYNS